MTSQIETSPQILDNTNSNHTKRSDPDNNDDVSDNNNENATKKPKTTGQISGNVKSNPTSQEDKGKSSLQLKDRGRLITTKAIAITSLQDLEALPAMQIPAKTDKVITIPSKKSLRHAFRILIENNILSAPIYDKELDNYLGFVDILDIVQWVVDIIGRTNKESNPDSNSNPLPPKFDDTLPFLEQELEFISPSPNMIADLSKRDPFIPIRNSATILELHKLLASGIHRVPILDEENNIVRIISQIDLVDYFHRHKDLWKDMGQKTLKDLGLGMKEVVSTTTETISYNAFKLMMEKGVSGLAVLDANSEALIGQISCTDIREITPNAGLMLLMYLPVKDFLKRRSNLDNVLFFCTESDTFETAMDRMINFSLHRLFITSSDEPKKLVGVISLVDILQHFLKYLNNDKDKHPA